MRKTLLLPLAALAVTVFAGVAQAETGPTPRQIQNLIADGQPQAALGALDTVLRAHPDSGIAWYLSAEAQDAIGNEPAARADLATADQDAPGLPFAKSADVAALRAHLAQQSGGHGVSRVVIVLAGLFVLFILVRLLFRSRRYAGAPVYQDGFPPGYAGRPPGGPFPYGPGGGTAYGPVGGGGNALLSGLAAGAGFAAGERIIDDLAGGNGGGFIDPGQGMDQAPPPDRDDGLSGSPGWDDGNSGNFDPNDSNW
jgi:hypothetical protein